MLRIHTLVVLLLSAFVSRAQIEIGANEMPHEGDDLYRAQANLNPFINYAATGPAHTWNFSNLSVAGDQTTSYQSVASTNFVYALVYADIFFNPNRANHARAGVDIPFYEQLPISDPYTFFYRSNSVYKKVGFGAGVANIPIPIIFEEQDVIYNLPLQYGDADNSSSAWNISLAGLAYYGYKQDRTNEVDGWGAITTPAGVFDVLRVKTTLEGRDTINLDTLGLGFNIERPIVREYKWLAQGLRVPVLQINTTELFGLELVSEIFFYDAPRALVVVPPLASTICPGSTIGLGYEATGTYNAGGFFVPANNFTAQLSDANGDFTNPVNLGSLQTTTSGTFTVTIPANTPAGTGYRIRVVSSSPDFIGEDNGFDITIDGSAPTASIIANGTTEFCAGGFVTLQTEEVGGATYVWSVDGDVVADAVGSMLEVSTSGAYSVSLSNACGTGTSEELVVVVSPAPEHTINGSTFLSCNGEAISITAENTSGQSSLAYQWYLNGNLLTGATDAVLQAPDAGDYYLEVTNTATGCTFTTNTVTLIVENVVAPIITSAGSTTFCEGGSVELTIDETPDHTYAWYVDGGLIAGATEASITVETPGEYTAVVTSASGCSSAPSQAASVVVNAPPEAPGITASGASSFCEGDSVQLMTDQVPDATYTWYVDGNAIADATDASITVYTSGDYTVVVTSAAECASAPSQTTTIVVNAPPPTPIITQAGDSLLASGTGSYQWFVDGNLLPGAEEPYLLPIANGAYAVMVTDANGCSSMSEPYAFINTGLAANAQHNNVSLYPNPSGGLCYLSLDALAGMDVSFEVVDASGRRILTGRPTGTVTTMDLGFAPAGVYTVRVVAGPHTEILRLVLN